MTKALPPVIDDVFCTCHEQMISQWASQQPQFKLFFALVWLCDTEHLILEVSEGITIFDELCRILKGALIQNPEAKNIKLKQLCCFTVFPVLVNKIKPVLASSESDHLMGILEQAFKIEWGNRDQHFKYLNMLGTQHKELIKSDSIKIKTVEMSDQFQKLTQTLSIIYNHKDATEKTTRDSLSTLNDYLEIFNTQVIKPLKDKQAVHLAMTTTTFLREICEHLIEFCRSFYDSVRDEASRALLFIGINLCKFDIPIPKETQNLVQQLRANLTLGWNDAMTAPIKECAEMEKDVCKWMFIDAQEFIDKMLTVMMDYPSTRDQLAKFTMVLNRSLPFLLMNDYRISVQSNRLQRIEVLKQILTQGI